MTTWSIFYHKNKVGSASGESSWQAIDNFVTLHEGEYVRKFLYAKPAITAFKKSNPFKNSKKNKSNVSKRTR